MFKNIAIAINLFLIGSLFCSSKMFKESEQILSKMNLDRKIGQMIMVSIPDSTLTEGSREIIEDFQPGGIILFGYNISSKENNKKLIDSLQDVSMNSSGIPLFVSTDQEGGRVSRIRDGVTQFPGNMVFGIVNDKDLVFNAARILGMQLRLSGINMNLAPVLDINNNPENPVINSRSFGSDEEIVKEMGKYYIKGLQKSRCISVGKHFPGHGDTNKDSHLTLPVINYDMNRLNMIELAPFRTAIKAGVEGIMTAHIAYPALLGDDTPATLSKKMLTVLLRQKLKFDGLIITDDMEMNAVSKIMDLGEAAVRSVDAGSDIILISSHGESIAKITNALKAAVKSGVITEERINQSVRRIIETKLRYDIMKLDNKNIRISSVKYNTRDLEILKYADMINHKASKNAIYYYGKQNFDSLKKSDAANKSVFVSNNAALIKELKKNVNNFFTIVNDDASLFKMLNRKTVGLHVYYHVDHLDEAQSASIQKLNNIKDLQLTVISTGNPFPVARISGLQSALFSFSNTEESLRQIAACIKGDFQPKRKINFSLGIDG